MSSEQPQSNHPELAAEQAYVERAYDRLEAMQHEAIDLARKVMAQGARGGTLQARYERDVLTRVGLHRSEQLEIGDESLCFGRIDPVSGERYYVGRRGVLDEDRHPLVIDWRVPAAAPFYRATGRDPMGLRLRRHLLCRGRHLIAIEDELFDRENELGLSGLGALVAALEQPRTGSMRDIVATVQAEQDEIIRAEVQGILAVQGGPGTGKTAVALHRAAYLLFTHRIRLERQGVLIVGPNRLFLRYIDQVLPALGETGADLMTIDDMVPVKIGAVDEPLAARIKGDVRMARIVARAVGAFARTPKRDMVVRYEGHQLVIRRQRLETLVTIAKRSRRTHNRRRAMLHSILVKDLWNAYVRAEKKLSPLLPDIVDKREVMKELRHQPGLNRGLDEIWPALTPQGVLRELFASREMLESVAGRMLKPAERDALHRPKTAPFTHADVPLLDEIAIKTGKLVPLGARRRREEDDDEIKTYGHILVDEVQDLSPMALRMIARRSRSGWMTIVGDLAQAVGTWTPPTWDDIIHHLKPRSGSARRELTINYRTPAEIMRLAESVRLATAPELRAAQAVRAAGVEPGFERTEPAHVVKVTAEVARAELEGTDGGSVAVIAPRALLAQLGDALGVPPVEADDEHARLGAGLIVTDADTVKGLEFDGVVIVEPAALVGEHGQGLRALYVALTRATRRLSIVHAQDLPAALERARTAR